MEIKAIKMSNGVTAIGQIEEKYLSNKRYIFKYLVLSAIRDNKIYFYPFIDVTDDEEIELLNNHVIAIAIPSEEIIEKYLDYVKQYFLEIENNDVEQVATPSVLDDDDYTMDILDKINMDKWTKN